MPDLEKIDAIRRLMPATGVRDLPQRRELRADAVRGPGGDGRAVRARAGGRPRQGRPVPGVPGPHGGGAGLGRRGARGGPRRHRADPFHDRRHQPHGLVARVGARRPGHHHQPRAPWASSGRCRRSTTGSASRWRSWTSATVATTRRRSPPSAGRSSGRRARWCSATSCGRPARSCRWTPSGPWRARRAPSRSSTGRRRPARSRSGSRTSTSTRTRCPARSGCSGPRAWARCGCAARSPTAWSRRPPGTSATRGFTAGVGHAPPRRAAVRGHGLPPAVGGRPRTELRLAVDVRRPAVGDGAGGPARRHAAGRLAGHRGGHGPHAGQRRDPRHVPDRGLELRPRGRRARVAGVRDPAQHPADRRGADLGRASGTPRTSWRRSPGPSSCSRPTRPRRSRRAGP